MVNAIMKAMIIEMFSPEQFNTIAWKNGQGQTTELAINEQGCLENFDWRLSIATVSTDGYFSNFSGYQRNLILIEGKGICLSHDDVQKDVLEKPLDIASFNGGCKTYGKLTAGPIKDFNVMTKIGKVSAKVHCYKTLQQVEITLSQNSLCFAYSLSGDIKIVVDDSENNVLPAGYLAKLSRKNSSQSEERQDKVLVTKPIAILTGSHMIIVQLQV